MTDLADLTPSERPCYLRPDIQLADGSDVLTPRAKFARDELHISDRTAARMNLPTTYIGGVAHVLRKASLRIVAERVRQRNPEPRRRRRAA
jgi:hypothetical protein